MLKRWMDTVHNQNVSPERESNSIMFGKGFTLEDLLRSAFTEF